MAAAATVLLLLAAAAARELDPAACPSRFDVQRDKIIRTEESREMGARYLAELDVGARAECLRLCCETDACDVFVYEEKSPGSCYLFACGPPEDFRCKFTAHGNFSSGVLALSRRLAELQDAERAAPPAPPVPPAPTTVRSTTSTTTTPAPTTTTPPPAPPPPPRPAPMHTEPVTRGCSRYEFACRHGGECIAVYNACDGVPQCADGSDEAPELGCPARAPPAPPAAPLERPAPREPPLPPEPRWPHRLTQAQPRRHYPAPEDNSVHIFSHTGGLLQAGWRPPRPHVPGLEVSEAGEVGDAGSAAWEASEAAWEPRRAWPVPPAAPPLAMQEMEYPRTMPELPPVYAGRGAPHDAPKKAPPAPPAPPPPRPPPAPPATPPATLPPPPVDPTTEKRPPEPKVVAAAAADAAEAHAHVSAPWAGEDGRSESAPAALLLLILGVVLTGAVGAALGCGRGAGRRRRRAPPSANDYLVNGMYL